MTTFFKSFLFNEEVLNQIHIFAGNWLDSVMVGFTMLGNDYFYIVMIPVLYWCFNRGLAIKVGGSFLIATLLNDVAKFIFQNPRPVAEYLVAGVRELNIENIPKNSPGFPSGHAQSAFAFWGALAYYLKNRYITLLCAAMILLISYSRLYLAVHHLGDVAGGLVFGGFILVLYVLSVYWIEKKYEKMNDLSLIIIVIIVPFILFKALPGNEVSRTMGVFSGFLIGIILGKERVRFSPGNSIPGHLLKVAAGLSIVFLMKSSIKLFPPQPYISYFVYWIMGFWVTFIAPLIFSRFEFLKGREEPG